MFNILQYYLPKLQRKRDIESVNKLCYHYYKSDEKFITNIDFVGKNVTLRNLTISFYDKIDREPIYIIDKFIQEESIKKFGQIMGITSKPWSPTKSENIISTATKYNLIINDKFEIENLVINLESPPGENGFYPFVSTELRKCYSLLDDELDKFYKSRDEKVLNFNYETKDVYINSLISKLKEITYKNTSLKTSEFQKFVNLFELDYKKGFVSNLNKDYETYIFYDKEVQEHDNFKLKYDDYVHFEFDKICQMTNFYNAYKNIKYKKVNDADFIKNVSNDILEKEMTDSESVVNILLQIIDRNINEYNNEYVRIIQEKAPYNYTTLHPWIDILRPLCGLQIFDDRSWIANIDRYDEITDEYIEQVLLIDDESSKYSVPMRELKIRYSDSIPALIKKIKSLK